MCFRSKPPAPTPPPAPPPAPIAANPAAMAPTPPEVGEARRREARSRNNGKDTPSYRTRTDETAPQVAPQPGRITM